MTTTITLVRAEHREFTKQEKSIAWRVLGAMVRGHGEHDDAAWRALWSAWANLEAGEMSEIAVHVERFPPSHRRHMALENAIWHAQERFENEERLRDWLKLQSGFFDWVGEEGKLVPVPRSASYSKTDELAMRKFTADLIAFMRTERAAGFLWPHLTDRARTEMVHAILKPFEKEKPR